jgi:sulfur-oxidizing protein SoxY
VAGLLATAGAAAGHGARRLEQAAFDAKTMAEAVKALGGGAPVGEQGRHHHRPGHRRERRRGARGLLHQRCPASSAWRILVEKNPSVLAAVFDVTDAVDANFSTRVKMGQSSNVFAVAIMDDGKVLYAVKEIKVTLGGCGG